MVAAGAAAQNEPKPGLFWTTKLVNLIQKACKHGDETIWEQGDNIYQDKFGLTWMKQRKWRSTSVTRSPIQTPMPHQWWVALLEVLAILPLAMETLQNITKESPSPGQPNIRLLELLTILPMIIQEMKKDMEKHSSSKQPPPLLDRTQLLFLKHACERGEETVWTEQLDICEQEFGLTYNNTRCHWHKCLYLCTHHRCSHTGWNPWHWYELDFHQEVQRQNANGPQGPELAFW